MVSNHGLVTILAIAMAIMTGIICTLWQITPVVAVFVAGGFMMAISIAIEVVRGYRANETAGNASDGRKALQGKKE